MITSFARIQLIDLAAVTDMVIRNQQVAALAASASQHFESELVRHCKQFSPKLCEVAGENNLTTLVRTGITRAYNYGFTDRILVRFYIELMLTLGSEFDSDPQFPWVQDSLQLDPISHPQLRANQLYSDLTYYLDRIAGPRYSYALAALQRFGGMEEDTIREVSHKGLSAAVSTAAWIYPEKFRELGETRVVAMITKAREEWGQYDQPSDFGSSLIAGLMLILGHGICRDPMYSWISSVLKDQAIVSPLGRAERLFTRVRIYAEHALKYAGGR
jgi:hypothetical protein